MEYRTEYVTVTETECSTTNTKDCQYTWEGKGDNMKWVLIPGTCKIQPNDKCKDVTKQVPLQVPQEVCGVSKIKPERKTRPSIQNWCIHPDTEEVTVKPLQLQR